LLLRRASHQEMVDGGFEPSLKWKEEIIDLLTYKQSKKYKNLKYYAINDNPAKQKYFILQVHFELGTGV